MSESNLIIPNFDDQWDKALKVMLSTDPEKPEILNVFLKGRIDSYNTEFFQSKMEKILQSGIKKVVFRCSSLEYISSSGLGVFANYYQKFKELNRMFVFIDIPPKVLEVFQLLGFSHFFNIAKDVSDITFFFNTEPSATAKVFPKVFTCPICNAKLKAVKSGKFRCSNCRSIISVSEDGVVSFN